jgi:hypothetical protein
VLASGPKVSWCVCVCVCVCTCRTSSFETPGNLSLSLSLSLSSAFISGIFNHSFNNLLTQLPGGADEERLNDMQGGGGPEAQGPNGELGKGRGPEACHI